MLKNAAKGALTIAELGWQVFPPGDLTEWDGLTHCFLREFDRRGDLKGSSPLKKWASVARHCLSQSQSHRKDL